MRFDKEELFKELVKKHGMNLYLGAGFSVYAYNEDGEKLPLGDDINNRLIELFSLDKSRNFNLSKTCQKIKIDNSDMLEKKLKEIYTVKSFDKEYLTITRLPIKNIITINIDNLLEKIYDDPDSSMNISDTAIYGSLEREKFVSLYKLHGSVTYPVGSRISFTETELTDLFVKDSKLFETVSYKLSTAPTIFWGTRLYDSNTMQLICNSEAYSKSSMQKWLVVYPDEKNMEYIEDYEDLGFNIIEADTKEMINYLGNQSFAKNTEDDNKYIYREYREKFPANFICKELKKSGVKRPVVDFFAGAEPIVSDIVSNNVTKTSYYNILLETILNGNITLITGIPGCGKSTLLMQLAFSDELSGRKFWFNNIIKQEAEKLVNLVSEDKNVTIFIDNLYSNIDALQVLKDAKNVKLVVAERALNYEYVKRFLNISSDRIVDISELNKNDVQVICKSMNRSSSDAFDLMGQNENISLLEIVFHTATSTQIHERIKSYVKDLKVYSDEDLKIDLLELFTLVNYTSFCGIPCSMDMMYFYFSDCIDSYKDIIYALEKMNRIIVESTDEDNYNNNQDYKAMRSKLFAEKSFSVLDSGIMSKVMNKFLDKVGIHIIYRYDIFKRRAYDADLTKKAFELQEGIDFYEKVLKNNKSPYVRHQYALFLQRKNEYELAWKQIDQAYTESKKKIFSIANTHAIIMFEMNICNQPSNDVEVSMLKKTIEKSFLTLEFCITQDVRVNYHILTYARNAIRYYEKYGWDNYAGQYVDSALNQLGILLNSNEYIFHGTLRELKNLQKQLVDIKKLI